MSPTANAPNTAAYRSPIYDRYVSGRLQALAPATVDGLRPRAPHLRKLIRHHFPSDRGVSIIDLGCGHGALIHFARLAGYRNIEGVDSCEEQLAAARRLGIVGLRQGDLFEALSAMPDCCRDLIVTLDVIEHFRKDELMAFAQEVHRVLRTDGRWIIHAPNGASPFVGRVLFGDFTHELAFTRESLGQFLLSSGFTSVECFEDAPTPHGVASATRWLLWKCLRAAMRLWLAIETGDMDSNAVLTQNLFVVAVKLRA
jgi:SAM-dependent methyltransferase